MSLKVSLSEFMGMKWWTKGELIKFADSLHGKNIRLRALLQQCVNEQLDTCGDCWGGLCEDCDCWLSEHADELRELGIEVES